MSIEALTRTIMSKMDGIGKWQADFFLHLVLLWLQLRGKYSFESLCRQGKFSAFTYRKWFSAAFDSSFMAKSGTHTYGIGYFRTQCRHRRRSGSGCAQAMKKGLEIAGLAAVDVINHTAFHYQATQTLLAEGESLLAYYAKLISGQADRLLSLSTFLVVDAYFSKYSFVEKVTASGLQVITRLRDDARLFYPY